MPRPALCATPGTAALAGLAGRPRFHQALWSDKMHPRARPVRLVHLPDLPFRVRPATAVGLQRVEVHLYYFWEIGSALRIRVGSLQKGPRALPGGPSCGLGRLQQCPRSEGRGLGPPEPGDSQRGAAAVGAHTTRGALDAVGSGCWLPLGTQPEAPGGLSLRGSHPFLKWKR